MENAGPGSRGTGSRRVENTGSGGKHGVPFFPSKYEFSSLKMRKSRWKIIVKCFKNEKPKFCQLILR